MAEVHENRTHQGRSSRPPLDLKSRRPTRTYPPPSAIYIIYVMVSPASPLGVSIIKFFSPAFDTLLLKFP